MKNTLWNRLLIALGFKSRPVELFELEHELALNYGLIQMGTRGPKWVVRCPDNFFGDGYIGTSFDTYESARRFYFGLARLSAELGSQSVPSPTSPDPEIHF